jgi:hypothetical protein
VRERRRDTRACDGSLCARRFSNRFVR